MTKLQIISRLWSTIYDLKLKQKSEAEIDKILIFWNTNVVNMQM